MCYGFAANRVAMIFILGGKWQSLPVFLKDAP